LGAGTDDSEKPWDKPTAFFVPFTSVANTALIMKPTVQEKWRQGYAIGWDCIAYANGTVTVANTYRVKDPETGEIIHYWFPLCDASLEGIIKYHDDIWTEIGIFGAFEYENQKFVFGNGAMGNEGYVTSTKLNGDLNWSVFFTFSNPIHKAEVIDKHLICYGDTGTIIDIDLANITQIQISHRED